MADISKEIKDFAEAEYGEEVRGSMISLAEKVNREVETNTTGVNQAINNTNAAAARANKVADDTLVVKDITNTAATNANTAAVNANATRQDILNRLAAGEFKGEKGDTGAKGDQGVQGLRGQTGAQGIQGTKGDKGDTGAQGESGIMVPSSGMFSLFLDPDTGDLWAEYPDGSSPPRFEYDSETGDLYYVTD